MSYSDILIPRDEVLKGQGIQGIVDLENLRSNRRGSIEASPKTFFDLTYPTSDIKLVVRKLHERFNSTDPTAGLFLLEGLKGSGKSHIELLIYHLFKNPKHGQEWLKKYGLTCNIPEDCEVIIHKFTDFPIGSVWKMVFDELGVSHLLKGNDLPNLDLLREALANKKLILILDELEIGFQSLNTKVSQAQNLSFLQMISEEAARSDKASITIFASVYNSTQDPGATLKRVPRVDIRFSEREDKKSIVLHRLFSNYLNYDRAKAEAIIQSYTNQWKQNKIRFDEKYIKDFADCFPFTPELIDMLLNRVLATSFQGNRGPLSLLGRLVRNTHNKENIISAANLTIKDAGIKNLLIDLDTNQTLIQCADNDLKDLESLPLADDIVSATLIATLSSSGSHKGIKEVELSRQIIKPGYNYNDYSAALNAFEKLGAYFQHAEDFYFFDNQEKPYAKVEYRSLKVPVSDALDFALDRFSKKLFNDHAAVVLREPATAKAELFKYNKNELRFVLSPRRLSPDERIELYNGLENQNLVILLEPKSDLFNVFENNDIIKWSQLAIAAEDLRLNASDSDRKRQYEKIAKDNGDYVDDAFKRAGLVYLMPMIAKQGLSFELESLGSAFTRQSVIEYLQKNIFPRLIFEEHISLHLKSESDKNWVLDHTVSEIKETFKKTLGFPVIVADTILIDSIKNLCINKVIGLSHSQESFCGRNPYYQGNNWNDVRVVEPFIDEFGNELLNPSSNGNGQDKKGDTSNNNAAAEAELLGEPFNITTVNVPSVGELRIKLAEQLSDKEDAVITRLRFSIYSEQNDVDFNSLPASLRGSLSDIGDFHLELSFARTGTFSKSQAESITEQLPVIQNALYKAELKGIIKAKVRNAG